MTGVQTCALPICKQSEGDKGAVSVADFTKQLLAEIEGNPDA